MARDTLTRLRITKIVPDSQAETLELLVGDIILSYDGKTIADQAGLTSAIEASHSQAVEMVISRDEKEIPIRLKKGRIGIYTEPCFF